jgi:hypothetical protein
VSRPPNGLKIGAHPCQRADSNDTRAARRSTLSPFLASFNRRAALYISFFRKGIWHLQVLPLLSSDSRCLCFSSARLAFGYHTVLQLAFSISPAMQ